MRLDKYLVSKYPDISRSQIQKAISAGQVLVNQKQVSKHYDLKPGDKVEVTGEITNIELDLKPNPEINLDIVFEDDNYLVLNKPAGLIVHPSEAHPENDTLINGVMDHYPEVVEVGESNLRYGIVHRLDREVSGLIVVAKTQEAFLDLKKQFKARTVFKQYLALVHGQVQEKHDFIKLSIERSKTKGYKMAAKPEGGKEAITEYEIIQQFDHFTFLKVIIHTGRTHQIRVHLNALNHTVVGDELYRPKSLVTRAKLDRVFLHAYRLEFNDLNGEKRAFQQELPPKLQDFVETLD